MPTSGGSGPSIEYCGAMHANMENILLCGALKLPLHGTL